MEERIHMTAQQEDLVILRKLEMEDFSVMSEKRPVRSTDFSVCSHSTQQFTDKSHSAFNHQSLIKPDVYMVT